MPKLTVELVPATCWWSNLRSILPKKDWDVIRRAVYRSANYRCEICQGRGAKWPVEAHEIWSYDDELNVQKLEGMIALCPLCHEVKHLGHAELRGKIQPALRHLANINGWSYQEAVAYAQEAFQKWEERSAYEWDLNLDILEEYGIELEELEIHR